MTFFFWKGGDKGKKHPESMHTHHAQAPPSAKVPRIGGEYIQVEFEIVDVPFCNGGRCEFPLFYHIFKNSKDMQDDQMLRAK